MARPEDEPHRTPDPRTNAADPTTDRVADPGVHRVASGGPHGVPPGHPGRPSPPRRRHGPAWAVLGAGLVLLVAGVVVGHGLLIATGLVVAGVGAHLFDYPRPRPRYDERG